jgi:hypothetical protein
MFFNVVWLAVTNIKRRKLPFVNFFLIAFFISQALFLMSISTHLLRSPDFTAVQSFFYIIGTSVLLISIILLGTVSILFVKMRGRELCILRLQGTRKSDILFLSSLEISITACAGAVAGTLVILMLILSKVLYLPYFLEGLKTLRLVRLIGLGGQAICGVVLIELVVTVVTLALLLKRDIPHLLRQSL